MTFKLLFISRTKLQKKTQKSKLEKWIWGEIEGKNEKFNEMGDIRSKMKDNYQQLRWRPA